MDDNSDKGWSPCFVSWGNGVRVGEREGEGCKCTTSFPQGQRRQRQVMGGILGDGADLLGKGGKGGGE